MLSVTTTRARVAQCSKFLNRADISSHCTRAAADGQLHCFTFIRAAVIWRVTATCHEMKHKTHTCVCTVCKLQVRDSPLSGSVHSACSGLVSATLGTPADVVKTRVMNQPTDHHGRYGSAGQPGAVRAAGCRTTYRPPWQVRVSGVNWVQLELRDEEAHTRPTGSSGCS